MSLDDDPFMKYRELMYVKLDLLGLKTLDPLRGEIVERMGQLKIKIDSQKEERVKR